MKKKAEFNDDELRVIEKAIAAAIGPAIVFGGTPEYEKLDDVRMKVWLQLEGDEATDVEGI